MDDKSDDSERSGPVAPTGRSFLARATTFRSGTVTSKNVYKGPLGLNTLHQPTETAVGDLIFVHGLGGGSIKTWSKNDEPGLFWPKTWLSEDPEFQDIRIHSFGYDSNWDKESILNIHDFAKSLLLAVKDCPAIPRDDASPLAFICHSLGGLVAKRAYVLSKLYKEYHFLSERIRSIVFLGTPHRGSNMAEVLSRILQVTSSISSRPFVNDLHPNSSTIQSINEEFPHHCQGLQLYSFYETNPMSIGVKKVIIVPKDSAVLGYHNERSTFLNANHRELCKFANKEDPNYRALRNSLASMWVEFRLSTSQNTYQDENEIEQWVNEYLEVDDTQDNEFQRLDLERIAGSCAWILEQQNFIQWMQDPNPSLYWLHAKPGAGKSVLCSSVIKILRENGNACVLYFCSHSDKSRLSISSFLRSVIGQLCSRYINLFEFVQRQYNREPNLFSTTYQTIWRKLFVEGVFRLKLEPTPYLALDAVDECKNSSELVQLLTKMAEFDSIRIFVTSRYPYHSYGVHCPTAVRILAETIPQNNTEADIRLYINENADRLPALGQDQNLARQNLIDSILAKSSGCFLWVRLIIHELRSVHTAAEIEKVLHDVPSDMDELYNRILNDMASHRYGKLLTKAILAWVACSIRPLDTEELHKALELDIQDSVDNVHRSISSTCSQLVFVDDNSYVKMIHQTAREFILRATNPSEFVMDRRATHKRLAVVCLKYLSGSEMDGSSLRRPSGPLLSSERSRFAVYAATCLAEHVAFVSPEDDDMLHQLARFLSSNNVFAWIEFLAEHKQLRQLTHTGRSFKRYLQRRQKHGIVPLGRDVAVVDAWAVDLIRIVTKFGRILSESPSSINRLIPPFCPSDTPLRKQFGVSKRSLEVVGLSQEIWDDCSSVIMYQNEVPTVVACSSSFVAVGLTNGLIKIHENETMQELRALNHGEPLKALSFGDTEQLMASMAFKSLWIWNTNSWQTMWKFQLENPCMDFIFFDDDRLLVAATRDNQILAWDLSIGSVTLLTSWLEYLNEGNSKNTGRPNAISISQASALLAVVYRGGDIIVWDIENERLHDIYGQDVGSLGTISPRRSGLSFVQNMKFSDSISGLLAASYNDGELVVFNTLTSEIQARVSANVHTMATSPNGLTLAGGNSAGIILIFEFETLKLLYRITSEGYGIKALTYSRDSLRLLDIRGSFMRVWDPSTLIHIQQEDNEHNSDTLSISTTTQDYTMSNTELTSTLSAAVFIEDHDIIICGRLDGSMCVFDSNTGLLHEKIIQEPNSIAINLIFFDPKSSIVIALDINSRIIAYKMNCEAGVWNSTKVFIHRAETSISDMVINEGCNRLLLSSPDDDILYSIDVENIEIIAKLSFPHRRQFKWINHPQHPDLLVLVMESAIHLYSWESLHRLTVKDGISITMDISSELPIIAASYYLSDSLLGVTFSRSTTSKARSSLVFIRTSDLAPANSSVTIASNHHQLDSKINCLIGSRGHRLVYLDHNGWVCSVEANGFIAHASDRHFFFPADWLSPTAGFMIHLFRNGNIAFVQRDEVAIIKRGLDSIEPGSMSSQIGKKSSLIRSSRSSQTSSLRLGSLAVR